MRAQLWFNRTNLRASNRRTTDRFCQYKRSRLDVKLPYLDSFANSNLLSYSEFRYHLNTLEATSVKIKGIKRGQKIELLEEINIPDGTEIYLEVEIEQPLSQEERLTKLNQIFGAWKNQAAMDEIFAEIDTERHAYQGRAIEPFDE